MDNSTSISEMKKWVKNFCEARNWDPYHNPKDLAIGAVTEASELLEIFRFADQKEELEKLKDDKSREHIGDELADVLFFLLRFSERFDFDLAANLQRKLEKNARKYPVGSR